MACACKVNQQLSYIQKKYGVGGPKQKKATAFNARMILTNMLNMVVAVLLTPIMLISILIGGRKVINVSRVFGLSSK